MRWWEKEFYVIKLGTDFLELDEFTSPIRCDGMQRLSLHDSHHSITYRFYFLAGGLASKGIPCFTIYHCHEASLAFLSNHRICFKMAFP